jgi:hypothetical protein
MIPRPWKRNTRWRRAPTGAIEPDHDDLVPPCAPAHGPHRDRADSHVPLIHGDDPVEVLSLTRAEPVASTPAHVTTMSTR